MVPYVPCKPGSVKLHPSDVLMFVKSTNEIMLITPPDARNEVMAAWEKSGYASFAAGGGGVFVTAGRGGSPGETTYGEGRFGNKPIYHKELPEDQAAAIRLVYRKVHEKGRTLHLVDVGKESAPRRLLAEHLKHLRSFPVLMRPDGRRLEGPAAITEARLDEFLAD